MNNINSINNINIIDTGEFYKMQMTNHFFQKLRSLLFMRERCKTTHYNNPISPKSPWCIYCNYINNEVHKPEKTPDDIVEPALDLIEIINRSMLSYEKWSINLLENCLYDIDIDDIDDIDIDDIDDIDIDDI